jgi:TP901 family phage tail tape measure protein
MPSSDTKSLGKLLVELLFEDNGFEKGMAQAEATTKETAKEVEELAKVVNAEVVPAFKKAEVGISFTKKELERFSYILDKDEEALKRQTKELERFSKELEKVGRGVNSLVSWIQTGLVRAFQAGSVAVAGFVAATAVIGANFEQSITMVGAIANATGDDLAALEAEARALGAATAFSATEAADGMRELASAGMNVSEIIDSTGSALFLAGASGGTLQQSTALLAATLNQFTLDASESSRVADVYSEAMNQTTFTIESLTEAMKYAGVVGAGFGMSLEETTAAVGLFKDLGLEGSMAGTMLREAFSEMAVVSAPAAARLGELGLTVEDINPSLHSFAEIMTTVGGTSMDASDAMVIFGQRAGAAILQLSGQFADGSSRYYELLNAFESSTGQTEAMYATLMDTVLMGFEQAKSAVEELMLTVFDVYKGDLKELLQQLAVTIAFVAARFAEAGDGIRTDLGGALDSITTWLDRNKGYLANTFIDSAEAVAKIVALFVEWLPLLDDAAILIVTVFAAVRVAQFTSAVTAAVTAIRATTLSLQAMGMAVVTATGGVAALTAGIAVLVTGLALLATRYTEAAEAAEALDRVNSAIDSDREARLEAANYAADLLIVKTRDELAAKAGLLAAQGKLTDEMRREIAYFDDLSGETAAAALAAGDLIEVNGQLVRSIDAIGSAEGLATVKTKAESAAAGVASLEGAIADYTAKLKKLKADDEATQWVDNTEAIAEVEAKLDDMRGRLVDARDKQEALTGAVRKGETALRLQAASADEAARAAAALGTQALATEEELDEVAKERAKRAEDEKKLIAGLTLAVEDAFVSEEDARARSYERQSEEIDFFYAQQAVLWHDNADELARIDQARQHAQGLALKGYLAGETKAKTEAAEEAAKKLAKEEEESAKKSAKEREDLEKEAQALLLEVRKDGMTEAERLEKEMNEKLARYAYLSAEEKAEIQEWYTGKIEEANDVAKDEAREAAAEVVKRWVDAFKAIGNAVVGTMKDAIGKVGELFSTVTGFGGFDVGGILSDAMTENAEAVEAGTETPGVAALATQGVGAVVDEAVGFASALAQNIGPILDAIVEGIPRLVGGFVNALPTLFAAIAARIPELVDALVAAIPRIVQALVDGLPVLFEALIEGVPRLVLALIEGMGDLVVFLIGEIPKLVRGLLAALPEVITGLVAQIPRLIEALVAAIPKVIDAVIDALPGIIQALVAAIPTIVLALVSAIPGLVGSLIAALPELFAAIVGEIPNIITTLIAMVPDVIVAFAKALPDLLPAIVALIPETIIAIVKALPEIVFALIEGIFVEFIPRIPELVWELVKGIVVGIVEGAKQIGQAIAAWLTPGVKGDGLGDSTDGRVTFWDAVDEMTKGGGGIASGINALGDLMGGGSDVGVRSHYSGIEYVPSTVRGVTLHPGEAVLDSHTNAMRLAGRGGEAYGGPGQGLAGAGPGASGGASVALQLFAEGKMVDEIWVRSTKRGHATGIDTEIRRRSSVRLGFDPGKLSQ